MTVFASVLVGIDFSVASQAALYHAARIAGWERAALRAAHVIDRDLAHHHPAGMTGNDAAGHDAALLADSRARFADFAGQAAPGVAVPFDVAIDTRTAGLLRAAEMAQADLVVMGCPDDERYGVGTLPATFIQRNAFDVLAVRDNWLRPFRRIVAAVDFSDTGRAVLQRAALFAGNEEARLFVVHVGEANWGDTVRRLLSGDAGSQRVREQKRILLSELQAFARSSLTAIDPDRIDWRIEMEDEHRSLIGTIATEIYADLIVMGARPAGSVHDRLFGSTYDTVLSDAQCSTLVVCPAGAAEATRAA